jgi:hypothetical protein
LSAKCLARPKGKAAVEARVVVVVLPAFRAAAALVQLLDF